MSVDKRPRSPSTNNLNNRAIRVIDLTSDNDDEEQPPRKRHKSVTPSRHHHGQNHAKPIFQPGTNNAYSPPPPPSSVDGSLRLSQGSSSKQPSPWKNRPTWSKPYSTGLSAADAGQAATNTVTPPFPPTSNGNKAKDWSPHDNDRLHRLSISQEKQFPSGNFLGSPSNGIKPEHSPDLSKSRQQPVDLEQERQEMIDNFKFREARSLKFNPSSSSLQPAFESTHFTSSPSRSKIQPRISSSSVTPLSQISSPRPQVEIKVPVRPTPDGNSRSSLSSTSVKQVGLIPPRSHQAPKFSINVPLTDKARRQQERKLLQDRLKKDVEYAQTHPDKVERILGLTGFSSEFLANLDEAKFKKAAQSKKRIVDRRKLTLEMDPSDISQMPNKLAKPKHFVHPKDQAKAILTARFAEQFEPSLTFSNTVNDRRLNGKFQFVSEYILRKGVRATGAIGHPGCNCVGPCRASCTCLLKRFKDEKSKYEWAEQIPQYERRPDGLIVLRDDFIQRHTIQRSDEDEADLREQVHPLQRVEISECNENCSCDEACVNRVVQKGRTVPLEIFETDRCGFGVRSSMKLVRGQFIEFYLGEVITENELVRREEAAEAGSTSYIYSLDWFASHQPYHIDGENFGSAMRFVNHSCDPNAGTFPVLNNKSTKQLHYVAFFALKDIPAGTEITIDYTPQAVGEIYELNSADDGMEKCYCGAQNCRQMLWLPGKERRARKKIVGKSLD